MEMMEQDEMMYTTYSSSQMTKTTTSNIRQDVEPPQCNMTGLVGTAGDSKRLKLFLGSMAGGMTNIMGFVEGEWELGTVQGNTSHRDAAYLSLEAMEEYENSLMEDHLGHTSYRDAAYLSLGAMEEYENSLVDDYMGNASYSDAAYLSLGAMEEYEDSLVEDYIGQKVGVKRKDSLYTYGKNVHCVSLQQPTHHMQDCAEERGFNAKADELAIHLKTVMVKQRFVEKKKLGKVMKDEVSQDVAGCTSIDPCPLGVLDAASILV